MLGHFRECIISCSKIMDCKNFHSISNFAKERSWYHAPSIYIHVDGRASLHQCGSYGESGICVRSITPTKDAGPHIRIAADVL